MICLLSPSKGNHESRGKQERALLCQAERRRVLVPPTSEEDLNKTRSGKHGPAASGKGHVVLTKEGGHALIKRLKGRAELGID